MSEFVRTSTVARLLDVDESTVRDWIAQGKLPAIRTPGGQWRIQRAEVKRLLEPGSPEPEAVA